VHAQAGLTGLDLERILAPRGLSIGDYPPVVLTSSLGGIIAVRTPGKSSARHGFFEDAVVGVSAVLADGRTVHTRVAPRRATGPDLRARCAAARARSASSRPRCCGSTPGPRRGSSARICCRRSTPRSRPSTSRCARRPRRRACASTMPPRPRATSTGSRCRRHTLLCAGTAGPTDLAACDRDLITSAVIAEGGSITDTRSPIYGGGASTPASPTPGPRAVRCN
jgi:alkyldihydroxyacetonephosphate synthase